MPWSVRVRNFLRRLRRRRQLEAELNEEIDGYFDILIERGIASGLTPAEARRQARLRFEGPEQVKQRVRDAWFGAPFEAILHDLRDAARSLRKSPRFTSFAVLTIALGLGANATVFSLVDGALFKPPGWREPERLVWLWENPRGNGPDGRNVVAAGTFVDWETHARSFESMAARAPAPVTYTGQREPRLLNGALVSAGYFDVFGQKAALGRTFTKGEDRPGRNHVAVIAHRLFLDLFGGNPSVIGRSIMLNGAAHIVIGVLPEHSRFEVMPFLTEIFVPLTLSQSSAREYYSLIVLARLKPNISIGQAAAEMQAISANLAERFPVKKGFGVTIDGYLEWRIVPGTRTPILLLLLAVVAVLLIACANLANLMMARATVRSHELALRLALGASRVRILRLLFFESVLLSSAGAIGGTGVALVLHPWIRDAGLFGIPFDTPIAVDKRVFLFLAVAMLVTSVLVGLASAVHTASGSPIKVIKEGGRSSSAGSTTHWTRKALVAGQIAVAFVLLVVGTLLLRSLERVVAVDVGFDPTGLFAVRIPLQSRTDPDGASVSAYARQLLAEVASVPGIRDVAVTSARPLDGWSDGMPFRWPNEGESNQSAAFKVVTPEYFRTLGLRLLAGRFLNDRDTMNAQPVLVVNESFGKHFVPQGGAVGKHLFMQQLTPDRKSAGPWLDWEIVGVVADERASGLEFPDDAGGYASFWQLPGLERRLALLIRGNGPNPSVLFEPVRKAVARVNNHQGIGTPTTIDDLRERCTGSRRMLTMLLGGFALLATLLACIGIYGLLSYVTAQRTKEMGVRVALGATRAQLVRDVLVGSAGPTVVGLGAGTVGALITVRAIQSQFYGTGTVDLPSLIGVAVLFIAIALAACIPPAWRAAKANPMTALRED